MSPSRPTVVEQREKRSVDAARTTMRSTRSPTSRPLLAVTKRDELLRLIGRRLCELVGAAWCPVHLLEQSTGPYRGQIAYPEHDVDPLLKRLTCGTEADRFTQEIVETQASVVTENGAMDPRFVKNNARDWHIVSMMGVPMVLRDEVTSIAFLDSEDQAQRFS